MTASPTPASESDTELDVLIVGAGLSGIGAACHLMTEAPGTGYELVEARGVSGGTWDLFRYPGMRSDSDMHTLGYRFRQWRRHESIAAAPDILRYLRDTAAEFGVDDHITYHTRAVRADWSSEHARWTVTLEDSRTAQRSERTCAFLYLCAGYYDYDKGYTPTWPGVEDFGGTLVHPQHWPADLDVAGKRVAVIGSGATAVTLVPALADAGAQVTMVQRSPSYVMSLPTRDPLASLLRKVLPERRALAAIRWKNAKIATAIYQLCRRYPHQARAMLRKAVQKQLPVGFDIDTHFTPAYQPWDQRMCLVPDGDFFAAIRSGNADMVTGHIDSFTGLGLRLASGATVEADIVVTATGLNLMPFGGIELSVDNDPVRVPDRVAYKGMMFDSVPNLAFAIGYTNASWTLKVDLVSGYVARLVRYMREHGYARVEPHLPVGPMNTSSFIEMTSGYFERSRSALPLQGDRAPWRLAQHYFRDSALFREPFDGGELRFGSAATSAALPGPGR